MIRTAKEVDRDSKKLELKGAIQDAIRTEESWDIILEVLSEILVTEIRAYNKELNKK